MINKDCKDFNQNDGMIRCAMYLTYKLLHFIHRPLFRVQTAGRGHAVLRGKMQISLIKIKGAHCCHAVSS